MNGGGCLLEVELRGTFKSSVDGTLPRHFLPYLTLLEYNVIEFCSVMNDFCCAQVEIKIKVPFL
jgi:hypothetical protein